MGRTVTEPAVGSSVSKSAVGRSVAKPATMGISVAEAMVGSSVTKSKPPFGRGDIKQAKGMCKMESSGDTADHPNETTEGCRDDDEDDIVVKAGEAEHSGDTYEDELESTAYDEIVVKAEYAEEPMETR